MYLHEDKGTIASLQKIIDLGCFCANRHIKSPNKSQQLV